jgi:hypothetical protein
VTSALRWTELTKARTTDKEQKWTIGPANEMLRKVGLSEGLKIEEKLYDFNIPHSYDGSKTHAIIFLQLSHVKTAYGCIN